uniref:DUF1127 domain-containing protein n=1 Tax=Caenorhabditis tropicalis TaxID=1561998 RepID=A0A1I7TPD1_9PELO
MTRFLDILHQYRVENVKSRRNPHGGLEFFRVERFIQRILRIGEQPIDIHDIREMQMMQREDALHMLWSIMGE